MPYGMTYKDIEKLSKKLSDTLNIEYDLVREALDKITREEVARIAKNEVRKEAT